MASHDRVGAATAARSSDRRSQQSPHDNIEPPVALEDDPLLNAREIEAFHKANPDIVVAKGLFLDGKVQPASEIVNLAKIPDRAGMLAQLVSIILGPGATIAGQLKSLTEKLEKQDSQAAQPATTNN